MQRFHQLLFVVSVLGLSWLGMMAVHELGHVVGSVATGGSVERVVLHPLAISRTDVSPNPQPAIVVWLGPVVGCLVPLAVLAPLPRRLTVSRNLSWFFAGFCLITNGAYISLGSYTGIGDCGEMLRTGTPLWAMLAFGVLTIPLGLYCWHRLGSLSRFLGEPALISPAMAYTTFCTLLVVIFLGLALSPQ